MGELLHNWRGILALLVAFSLWWDLASEWSSASSKRFLGLLTLTVGVTLWASGYWTTGLGSTLTAMTGLITMTLGIAIKNQDRREMNALPKGTRITRVVNSVKVLGIPVWRKVVSTEILPPEGQPDATH